MSIRIFPPFIMFVAMFLLIVQGSCGNDDGSDIKSGEETETDSNDAQTIGDTGDGQTGSETMEASDNPESGAETTVEQINCDGTICGDDQECCVTRQGASAGYQCVPKHECENSYDGAVVCREDSMCSDATQCCCKVPFLNEELCLSSHSCFGRTPCKTTRDCEQISDLLPIVCCPDGLCDVDVNCESHDENPQPICEPSSE